MADLVVFSGGPDINPELYGAKKIPETYCDEKRDKEDLALYRTCVQQGIPMLGICRGAQFLWAMIGGKLYQDVNNHNDGCHDITYLPTGDKYKASSVHHQSAIPSSPPGVKLLAVASESKERKSDTMVSSGPSTDFEMWAVPERAIVGIQGHPEYPGYPNYSKLCLDVIEQYVYLSSETRYKDGKLRLASPLKHLIV